MRAMLSTMDSPHEELLALERRREQNRIAQRRHRDNVRKRLRELGLDAGRPSFPSRKSQDRPRNFAQNTKSTGSLAFEIPISENDSLLYEASFNSLVQSDSQMPPIDGSVSPYDSSSSSSSSSSAGPLPRSPTQSPWTYLDPVLSTAFQPSYDSFTPIGHFDQSYPTGNDHDIPILPESGSTQQSIMPGLLNSPPYKAHALDSSMASGPTIPRAPSPKHLSRFGAAPCAPAPAHPRWTTPLHVAVSRGNLSMVHLLLEHGADPNAVNSEGATALHVGVISGHPTMVAELLQRGADPTLADSAGWLALHYAVDASDEQCLRVLLEAEQLVDYPIPSFEGR
ncbi:hypothetical protein ETB97_008729 [Aspergillus alliaceus]|uniref:Uncharacterized protein n=1 Tax=Petromyces alliaceus TaxID=209559 RepID=A0A8H6AHJ4_PETAA|nr:hypothetical protein ETB97_008729 [Aspergillus burnettii]